jgi:pheromone shutdown protein TraB
MEEVYSKFSVFAPFFGVMLLFVMPAVISVVNRVKGAFGNKVVPSWVWWVVSIVSSVGVAFYVAYLFSVVELYAPPSGVVAGVGALTGLSASGLIDISKFVAGTKR